MGTKAAMRHPGDGKPSTKSDIDQGVKQQRVVASTLFVARIVNLRTTTTHARWHYGATTRVFPRDRIQCAPILDQKQHQFYYH